MRTVLTLTLVATLVLILSLARALVVALVATLVSTLVTTLALTLRTTLAAIVLAAIVVTLRVIVLATLRWLATLRTSCKLGIAFQVDLVLVEEGTDVTAHLVNAHGVASGDKESGSNCHEYLSHLNLSSRFYIIYHFYRTVQLLN